MEICLTNSSARLGARKAGQATKGATVNGSKRIVRAYGGRNRKVSLERPYKGSADEFAPAVLSDAEVLWMVIELWQKWLQGQALRSPRLTSVGLGQNLPGHDGDDYCSILRITSSSCSSVL